MFSKVLQDLHMKDSLETEYCVRTGGKSLIKQKNSKLKHNYKKFKMAYNKATWQHEWGQNPNSLQP